MTFLSNLPFSKQSVIQSTISDPQNICWQLELESTQIGSQTHVIVQEGQVAMLFLQQTMSAILDNGSFPLPWVLETSSLNDLRSLKVYFFTTKTFTDQRWGTPSPILIQGKTSISLRAHGTFSYRLHNPKRLWRHIPINAKTYSSEDMSGELRSLILNQFTAVLQQQDFESLIGNREKLSAQVHEPLTKAFHNFGLTLTSFLIQSISLPENQMTSMQNVTKLEKLNELYRQGVLSQEEYELKKKEILKDI